VNKLWNAQRFTYAAVGSAAASLFTAGLLLVRSIESDGVVNAATLWAELLRETLTYGYVAVGTVVMSVGVGYYLGNKAERLEALSMTDSLTRLANRRAFVQTLSRELQRARRYDTPLALMVVDVDKFKQVNDAFGHHAGDRALRLVAESLSATCRATDLPARLGGDEFVVLAPLTTATEALGLAERIRQKLAAVCRAESGMQPISVSIGVADLGCVSVPKPAPDERLAARWGEALLGAADVALYAAKELGRDRAQLAVQLGGPNLPGAAPASSPRAVA
jgi:diguanylate cyclase (GGDEF)-like protein